MQKKKGISLIVLVITVIVMIILSGAIIIALNNMKIIGKSEDAVAEHNLNEVKNIASVAWIEAFENGAKEQSEYKEAVMSALEKNNITEEDYYGYAIKVTVDGVEFIDKTTTKDIVLKSNYIIPEGATYITGAQPGEEVGAGVGYVWDYSSATTYVSGDPFPNKVKAGDIFRYEDYEYVYNSCFHETTCRPSEWMPCQTADNGWSVYAVDGSKTTYGTIIETINGYDVIRMEATFIECYKLTTAPVIPSTVKIMESTFYNCEALTTAPVIPNSVTYMRNTFCGCTALAGNVEININSLAGYSNCFSGTTKPITLTGLASTTIKQKLASTANNGNVTY